MDRIGIGQSSSKRTFGANKNDLQIIHVQSLMYFTKSYMNFKALANCEVNDRMSSLYTQVKKWDTYF